METKSPTLTPGVYVDEDVPKKIKEVVRALNKTLMSFPHSNQKEVNILFEAIANLLGVFIVEAEIPREIAVDSINKLHLWYLRSKQIRENLESIKIEKLLS